MWLRVRSNIIHFALRIIWIQLAIRFHVTDYKVRDIERRLAIHVLNVKLTHGSKKDQESLVFPDVVGVVVNFACIIVDEVAMVAEEIS